MSIRPQPGGGDKFNGCKRISQFFPGGQLSTGAGQLSNKGASNPSLSGVATLFIIGPGINKYAVCFSSLRSQGNARAEEMTDIFFLL